MKTKIVVDKIPQEVLLKLLPLREGRSIFYEKDKYLSVKGDETDNDAVVEYLFKEANVEFLGVFVEGSELQVQTTTEVKSKKPEANETTSKTETVVETEKVEAEVEETETEVETEEAETKVEETETEVETEEAETKVEEAETEVETEEVEAEVEETETSVEAEEVETEGEETETVVETEEVETEGEETETSVETEEVETKVEEVKTEVETEEVETEVEETETEVETEEVETEGEETETEVETEEVETEVEETETEVETEEAETEVEEAETEVETEEVETEVEEAETDVETEEAESEPKEKSKTTNGYKRRGRVIKLTEEQKENLKKQFLKFIKLSSCKSDFLSKIAIEGFRLKDEEKKKIFLSGICLAEVSNESSVLIATEWDPKIKMEFSALCKKYFGITLYNLVEQLLIYMRESFEREKINIFETTEPTSEEVKTVENTVEPVSEEATEKVDTVESKEEPVAEVTTEEKSETAKTGKTYLQSLENIIIFTEEDRDTLKNLTISERAVWAFYQIIKNVQLKGKELDFSLEIFKVAMERRSVRKFENIYVDTLKDIRFSIDMYPARMCWAKIIESYTGSYIEVADFFEIAQKQILTEEEYEKVRR